MQNALVKKPKPAESLLLDTYDGEEIAILLLKIRLFLLDGDGPGYRSNMQEVDSILLDLACFFTELKVEYNEP